MTLPKSSLDLPPFFVPYPGALLTSDHIAACIRYDVKTNDGPGREFASCFTRRRAQFIYLNRRSSSEITAATV